MKAIVITKDSCTRLNTIKGEVIEAFRPSVVTVTELVKTLAMNQNIEPVGRPLPDFASDAEFLKFYTDSDRNVDLAIDSYLQSISEKEDLDARADDAAQKQAEADAAARAEEQARLDAEKRTLEEAQKKAAEEAAAKAAATAKPEGK